jgi:hypothetical protein
VQSEWTDGPAAASGSSIRQADSTRSDMPADAALPDLFAITAIDKFMSTLPESNDRPSHPAQFGVFCSPLIQFTSRHDLHYPIGDDHG